MISDCDQVDFCWTHGPDWPSQQFASMWTHTHKHNTMPHKQVSAPHL